MVILNRLFSKTRIYVLFVLTMLVAGLFVIPVYAEENNVTIHYTMEAITPKAPAELSVETQYPYQQWQVYIEEAKVWANIYGQTGSKLTLPYGIVSGRDQVTVRCAVYDDIDKIRYSNEITYPVQKDIVDEWIDVESEDEEDIIVVNKAPKHVSGTMNSPALAPNSAPADTYNVVVTYQFQDNSAADSPFIATLAAGSSFDHEVTFPTIIGYDAYVGTDETPSTSIHLHYDELDSNQMIVVTYKPAQVSYRINHYWQNADDDHYTLHEYETLTGYTGQVVDDASKEYNGFYPLMHDQVSLAADGSTEINIYYDRYYYLMNFFLDDGQGVDPIYARHGTTIHIQNPTKRGYSFAGWDKTVPGSMPIDGGEYTASWIPVQTQYLVVYWYQDSLNYDYYTVAGSETLSALTGTVKNSDEYADRNFTGKDTTHFEHDTSQDADYTIAGDGTTKINVYYKRKPVTYTFHYKNGDAIVMSGPWDSSLSTNGYTWPGDVTWKYYSDRDGAQYPESSWDSPFDSDSAYDGWTGMTFLGSFKDIKGNMNVHFYEKSDNNYPLYIFKQKLDGTYSDSNDGSNADAASTVKGTFTFSEKYEGFSVAQYSTKVYGRGRGYYWDTSWSRAYTGGSVKFGDSYGNYGLKIRYSRNKYTLQWYNYDHYMDEKKETDVYYEEPLSSRYFVPPYPSNLEPNCYDFAGWYDNSEFHGEPYDFEHGIMPAGNVTMFAKWVPVRHHVKIYKNKAIADSNGEIYVDAYIPHNDLMGTPDTPEDDQYNFIGWFYEVNGEEHVFNFSNTHVNRDLVIYGRWDSNVLVPYTIKFESWDGQEVSEPIESSALAGSTRTFEARGNEDLYPPFREGYFVTVGSHTMLMTSDSDNTYTFVYEQRDHVPYTVRYVDAVTGEELYPTKAVNDNCKAVVTEKFVPIEGYIPDGFQKRLVISIADGASNEIVFYYTPDENHARYLISHYVERTDGTFSLYNAYENLGEIGETVSGSPMTITGFHYDPSVEGTKTSGRVSLEGLELKLYYVREEYPYKVRYLERSTQKMLAEETVGTAKLGSTLTFHAKAIDEYERVSPEEQRMTIKIEDKADPKHNVITYYYQIRQATFQYVPVTPSMGIVSRQMEGVAYKSGYPVGSIPTPNAGYRFVGWFKDAECTIPVSEDEAMIEADNKLIPLKQGDGEDAQYISATYYAKFDEAHNGKIIINKSWDKNPKDAIFRISSNDGAIDLRIPVSTSATVADLPAGTYTVTEESGWTWRFLVNTESQTVTLAGGDTAEVSFRNTTVIDKWLSDTAKANNIFSFGGLE